MLIFHFRDSSERPGRPHSESGESALGPLPSSYVHILEPSSHIRAVFNVTLLGSGLLQLLSVTPIVKNGVLVKLPLVRVLSFFIYLSTVHRHTLPCPKSTFSLVLAAFGFHVG